MSWFFIKYTLRRLWMSPVYSGINLLAISVTLAIFIVCSSIINQRTTPLEIVQPSTVHVNRLESISPYSFTGNGTFANLNYMAARYLTDNLAQAELVSIHSTAQKEKLAGPNWATERFIKEVDQNFWQMTNLTFLQGQPNFQDQSNVVVIDQSTNELLFAGDALNKELFYLGRYFTVIAVVEDVPSTHAVSFSQIWLPLDKNMEFNSLRELSGNLMVMLEPATDDLYLQAELNLRAAAYKPQNKEFLQTVRVNLESKEQGFALDSFPLLGKNAKLWFDRGVLIFYAILLVIPALNLTNLSLSKIMERVGEIGIRRACGASTTNIIAQIFFENIILITIGSLLGYLLAVYGFYWLDQNSDFISISISIHWHWVVIFFAVVFLFTLLSTIVPALKMAKLDPIKALKGA